MRERLQLLQTKHVLQYITILLGFLIMAIGVVIMVEAGLGVDPWNVLHLGISNQTGIPLGYVMQVTGILIIIISYILGEKPNFTTMLNMFFVGYFVNVVNGLGYFSTPQLLWLQVVYCLIGTFTLGFGCALYMSEKRGNGPRDSLMVAIIRITKLRVSMARGLIEFFVTITGFLLGGALGIGTLIFAFLVGVSLEASFKIIEKVRFALAPSVSTVKQESTQKAS